MKLTCVTAVFNAIKSGNKENLIRCVQSVAALKTEHEHLIYDGASTDGTVDILRELEAKTPYLKVVSEQDRGIYFALNKGVRDAAGEWFYVLGVDDFIKYPERMDEELTNLNGNTQMLVSTVERDDGDLFFADCSMLGDLAFYNCYSHQGVIMRISLARGLGGFDESNRVSADYDMFWKVHKLGVGIKYVFRPFAYYAKGGFSSDVKRALQYDRELLKRHLGVSDDEVDNRFLQSYHIPTALRLFRYRDAAIRICARHLIYLRIRYFIRVSLYPIVLITKRLLRK